MVKPEGCIIVIFGASGDLARRKLIPALFDLCRQDMLPENFAILGVGRTEFTDDGFREHVADTAKEYAGATADDADCLDRFARLCYYQAMQTTDVGDYGKLSARLAALDKDLGAGGNFIFYLAIPPVVYETAAEGLAAEKLTEEDGGSYRRIVVEKPFGHDLASAAALDEVLHRFFDESQIYRIDHYLGKETVQNLLVFRFSNGVFEPLWNRNYVHDVQILAAEDLGLEGRGQYYDGAGALRDMFQNHILQVLGMFAMEPPTTLDARAMRNETLKVFQSLRPIPTNLVGQEVVRGQYAAGHVRDEDVPGYLDEPKVAPDSRTETFFALRLFIDNWRWGGVPVFVRTGKRLPRRVTEVVVNFRSTPHCLFGKFCRVGAGHNQLVVRIQPDEGITLRFAMKVPGTGFDVRDVLMDFRYASLGDKRLPGAYERLLLDCMLGDATLYARTDAVEACWAFVDPILDAWEKDPSIPLYRYPAGTWGPTEANQLLVKYGGHWRDPGESELEAE